MIKEIIDSKIPEVVTKDSLPLGDRSKYIGASDVVQCPRKVVLTKLHPQELGPETLIKFKRGHLAETILSECFSLTNYRWKTQMEFVHPENEKIKAHADFVFYTKDMGKIGIVEQKSVSFIPNEPYSAWVNQLQFQMGLAKLMYPNADIKGSLFVIDLNSGQYEEFNGYEPNDAIFEVLFDKAVEMVEYLEAKQEEGLPIEESPLCGLCPFKDSCPAFTGDEKEVPENVKENVLRYKELSEQEKEIKKEKDEIKSEILSILGNNVVVKFDGNKVSIKETAAVRVNTKRLKEEYPNIYQELQYESPYISFRVA